MDLTLTPVPRGSPKLVPGIGEGSCCSVVVDAEPGTSGTVELYASFPGGTQALIAKLTLVDVATTKQGVYVLSVHSVPGAVKFFGIATPGTTHTKLFRLGIFCNAVPPIAGASSLVVWP